MLLGVALDQQLGRLQAQRPAGGRGHGPGVDGKEVAPGGQHVGATARWRTAGPGGHKAPLQATAELQDFLRSAVLQAWPQIVLHALQHLTGMHEIGLQRNAIKRIMLQNLQCQQLQPLARIAGVAPGLGVDLPQQLGERAAPGLLPGGIERVEVAARQQVLRQRPDQAVVGALAVAHGVARQGQQGVALQPAGGRLAKDVQTVADLAFLEFAQVGIGLVQQLLLLGLGAWRRHAQVLVQVVRDDVRQDLLAQQRGPPAIQRDGFVVLVHHALQVARRAIAFGARQRRHQVVHDHRLGAALGLGALARIVDDEGVQVRHGAERQVRPAGLGQGHALAGQPFQVAVLAHVHHGIGLPRGAQPVVEGQVVMRWHQVRVVVAGHGVQVVAARWLDAHKHLAQAQPGHHEAPLAQHGIGVGRAPALQHGLLVDRRQAVKECLVAGQVQALLGRAQLPGIGIVGDALLQQRHQGIAVGGDVLQRIALLLQGLQDVDDRGRRVQPHAIAQAAFLRGVVGQDQRQALVGIGPVAQAAPAPGQLHHEGQALRMGLVLHHVGLGQRAAVRQPLEADGTRDDAAIHLGHGHVHGDVARLQAVGVVQPALLVAAGHDDLQHRDIARQRVVARGFQRRLGERGGVQDQRHLVGRAQLVQQGQAGGVLERQHGQRQGVHALGPQLLAQGVEQLGVARLQVRAVEQHHHHRLAGLPLQRPGLPPVLDRGHIVRRVVDGGGRQRPGGQRRLGAAQEAVPQVAEHLARVGRPSLAQVAPDAAALLDGGRALLQQVHVFRGAAGEHHQRDAVLAADLAHTLRAIRPVAFAAQVVDHDHAGMLQHLVHVQVHRGGLAQVHQVGQANRRQGLALQPRGCGLCLQLFIGIGQQRQRGVGRTQHHHIGRRLAQAGHKGFVVDKATGLDSEQVHQQAPAVRPSNAARIAPSSRSWPMNTRWVWRASSSRQRRSK